MRNLVSSASLTKSKERELLEGLRQGQGAFLTPLSLWEGDFRVPPSFSPFPPPSKRQFDAVEQYMLEKREKT